MAFDRLVEYINLRQAQRNSSFQAFDSALHYTPRLLPMMHVDAAYTAAISGAEAGADAGYDPRMIREVDRLVDFITDKLGVDLTQVDPNNPFWHTGNTVNGATGSSREARPQDWLFMVESGASAGVGPAGARPQSCANWVQELLDSGMFKM